MKPLKSYGAVLYCSGTGEYCWILRDDSGLTAEAQDDGNKILFRIEIPMGRDPVQNYAEAVAKAQEWAEEEGVQVANLK